jgi:uncharacterized protein (TIGR03437 family)
VVVPEMMLVRGWASFHEKPKEEGKKVRFPKSNKGKSNETRRVEWQLTSIRPGKRTIGRRTYSGWLLCTAALLTAAQMVHAQSSILGTNLIVDGNAEAGPAGTSIKDIVPSIPNWTRGGTGTTNVLPYGLTGYELLSDPAPPDHGFQYFVGAGWPNAATLSQIIDVSSGASAISAGNVKYTASAYLGSSNPGDYYGSVQMTVAFENANGQPFSAPSLGPLAYIGNGMSLQQQIGLVPAGTVQIVITLSFLGINGGNGAADSLSLVLNTLGTNPQSVLGTNLVANGGAEAGPNSPPDTTVAYIPDWSTADGISVAPYGGTGWITTSDPGPADRGVNVFCGWHGLAEGNMYQDMDVSAAATLIDSGQVTYELSAWLGSVLGENGSPTLTYTLFDWSGNQLAPTGQLGPTSHSGTALIEISNSGTLPSGTRRIHIALKFPSEDALADNIAFTLAAPSGPPVISPGGIIGASAFGAFSTIAPGSWIEIYGMDLASTTQSWTGSDFTNGVAPTSLGGVNVSVGGQAAYIDYISPGQVNALVASDAPTGVVPVTVTTSNGTSDDFWLIVNPTQPGLLAPSSFLISGKQYVTALLADGTYVLPEGAITGLNSQPAKAGDEIVFYGVGFGPVRPNIPAGQLVQQANTLAAAFEMSINKIPANVVYAGLATGFTGLYQFNVVVPANPGSGAVPLTFTLGGVPAGQTLYLAVGN